MGIEYEPNKMIVCVQGDDQLYFIDRIKKSFTKVRTDKSVHFELIKLGSSAKNMVLLRDDWAIKLINTQTMKIK